MPTTESGFAPGRTAVARAWANVRRALQEAFWLRASGDEAAADDVLREGVGPAVAEWARLDAREGRTQRAELERLIDEEERRAEDHALLVRRLAGRVAEWMARAAPNHAAAEEEPAPPPPAAEDDAGWPELMARLLSQKPAAPSPVPSGPPPAPARAAAPSSPLSPPPGSPTGRRMPPDPRRVPLADVAGMIDYVRDQERRR